MVKLAIVQTFISPQLEYGLLLLWASLPSTTTGLQVLKRPEKVFDDAVSWAVGFHDRPSVGCAILGLPTFLRHTSDLCCSFQAHLDWCSKFGNNPIVPLSTRFTIRPWGSIIDRFRSWSSWLDFKEWHRHLPPWRRNHRPLRSFLKEFLRDALLQEWASSSSVLVRYITPRGRLRQRGADRVLSFPPKLVRTALAWRYGLFGTLKRCPCGERFSRRHLRTCALLEGSYSAFRGTDRPLDWFTDDEWEEELAAFPLHSLRETKYHAIDAMCNSGGHLAVGFCLTEINKMLT